jgi:hypothetical protein
MGRYRTVDEAGRAIVSETTLPDAVGALAVADAPSMAQEIANSGRFAACVVKSMLSAALAEGAPSVTSCATQNIADQVALTDGTFPAVVRQVAISSTLGQRMAGVQ